MIELTLKEATVTITLTGLSLARSDKEHLNNVYQEIRRLFEERADNGKVELSDMIEGYYEDDYILLNDNITYRKSLALVGRDKAEYINAKHNTYFVYHGHKGSADEIMTPMCSCGWQGNSYSAHNDWQHTECQKQIYEHLK